MRKLIINADDFGLSEAVNRGIARAHGAETLPSASLLANGPAFEHAVSVAQAHPALGVGVHLNLLRGRPVADPGVVRPLLDEGGCFHLDVVELGRRIRGPDTLRAAETEYRAQIERVLAAGLTPTHLDSEKHHAVWGRLDRLAGRLARAYGIPAMRNLREPVAFALGHLPWPGMRPALRACLLRGLVTCTGRDAAMPRPDHFFGQTHIGAMTEPVWQALLAHFPDGLSEVMVHPGETEPERDARGDSEMGESWIQARRPSELEALLTPSLGAALRRYGIQPVTFMALASQQAAG